MQRLTLMIPIKDLDVGKDHKGSLEIIMLETQTNECIQGDQMLQCITYLLHNTIRINYFKLLIIWLEH